MPSLDFEIEKNQFRVFYASDGISFNPSRYEIKSKVVYGRSAA